MYELIEHLEMLRDNLSERRLDLAGALTRELHDETVAKLVTIHTALQAIEAAIADCRRKVEPQAQAMSG